MEEAKAAAKYAVEKVSGYNVKYPIAVDVESKYILELSVQELTDVVNAFCDTIAAAGYTPIVYSDYSKFTTEMDTKQIHYDIWLARYGADGTYEGRTIWQCTDHGEVPGIGGNVTVEYAFVDYGTLIPSDGWKQVGNDWYYVKNYIHQTGWLTVGDKTYYLGADGKMVHDITVNLDGKDYTFGSDGALQ